MKRQTYILIGIIGLNLAQYNLWQYIKHNFFYIAESAQYFWVGAIMFWLAKFIKNNTLSKKIKEDAENFLFVASLWIIFSVNDLTDLLFFNPNVFGWNEIAFCVLAFIITVIKLKKQWKTPKLKA